MKQNILKKIKALLFFTCLIYVLANPYQTAYHCSNALKMCAFTVLPSLFTFIVFSQMMPVIINGLLGNSHTNKHTGVEILSTVLFGITAGATPACASMAEQYKKHRISKESCENMLMLFNGCSASFIICVAGATLNDLKLAVMILICCTASNFVSYLVLSKNKNIFSKTETFADYTVKKQSFVSTVAKSLENTATICLNMCTYIVFFRVISGYICDMIFNCGFKNGYFITLIQGVFEVTSGINGCSALEGNEKIIIASFLCAFSGISICFQVSHLCAAVGIKTDKFIYSRLLSSVICPLLMILILLILPSTVTCYSTAAMSTLSYDIYYKNSFPAMFSCGIVVLTIIIIALIDKKYKKKR